MPEFTVHRADATLAAGLPREVAPEVAADTVHGWPRSVRHVRRTAPDDDVRDLRGPDRSIQLHAADTGPE
ncbi:hypothetical protein ABTX62_04110 [Streptomyces sp. NPDC096046]|uniref:hypothetical protein n=1 Tax=Streptomyces sp. NPDC096046 TaxID=3155542 RepID=UPI00332105EA